MKRFVICLLCFSLVALSGYAQADARKETRPIPAIVKNPPSKPVSVVNAFAREPVTARKDFICSAATGCFGNIFTVPPHKLLVIETVSVQIADPDSDQAVRARLEINFEGDPENQKGKVFDIPLTKTTFSSFTTPETQFAGTESIRLYVEDQVLIGLERNSTSFDTAFSASLSGYLIPVDSPTLSP